MQQCWNLVISLARRCPDGSASDDLWKSIPQSDEARTLAAALSWLNLSTRSPGMFTALLDALGDVNLGRPTAQNLPTTVRQSVLDSITAETHYDRLHKTRIPTERLSRYFRAVSNIVTSDDEANHIGSQFAHALVKRAMSDSDARTPELGDIAIHGLLYIRRFAPYISADWHMLVSMSATVKVGKVTALAVVATLREMRHDSWEKQLEILLWIVHHFLPHYEAKPDVIVDCIRQLLPVETLADLERHGRGLIALLCFILTCDQADIRKLIRGTDGLEAAVVSSLVALCSRNDTHNHRFASLANVFACERRVRLHSWTCEDVVGTVDSIDIHGTDEASAAQAVANLLHPKLSWHRTATASASQSAALGTCAEAIQLILMMHKTKPSIVLVLDHLLSNAVLVSLSRAAGHSVPALPRVMRQVASTFQSLQSSGVDAGALLNKFIFADISDGDNHVQWDLVTTATYACVQAMDGTPKPNPHLFKSLVSSFASLHAMSPSHDCWLSIARSLHAELTPERRRNLEKAKSSHKSWGPAALDYAAVLGSFNVAVGFSPPPAQEAGVVQCVPTPPPTPSKRAGATTLSGAVS
ncbi:hypothetical protein AURDEDRAFT_123361 [Auricularia subglabra TFB-10046 SS5]|nr:hypothetical protein AURDEDRAFT_123361 [Auricularia subglabra TFB-10046 SS5]